MKNDTMNEEKTIKTLQVLDAAAARAEKMAFLFTDMAKGIRTVIEGTGMIQPEKDCKSRTGYCRDCRFWDCYFTPEVGDVSPGTGTCRRYAPRPVPNNNSGMESEMCEWPNTAENDCCGEFLPLLAKLD
jgi:hypothetical protein